MKRSLSRLLVALSIVGAPAVAFAQANTALQHVGDDGRVQVFPYGVKIKGLNYSVRAVTAATDTVQAYDTEISDNATSNAITETLPAAAGVLPGRLLLFKKTDSSTNAVTISRAGSDIIDGATSIVLTAQYDSAILQSDGVSNWVELAGSIHVGNVTGAHFGSNTATPAAPAAGTGCNTSSAPTTGAGSTDFYGTVGITCGGTGTVSATVLTLTFVVTRTAAPFCQITPANSATQLLTTTAPFSTKSGNTTTTLVITGNTTGLPAGTYLWNYICPGT